MLIKYPANTYTILPHLTVQALTSGLAESLQDILSMYTYSYSCYN